MIQFILEVNAGNMRNKFTKKIKTFLNNNAIILLSKIKKQNGQN